MNKERLTAFTDAILVYPPCAIIGIMIAGLIVTFWPVLEARHSK